AMLDARQIARFKNESHAAGQLQHPHIVPVHCVGMERGIHFYAMQLIDGDSVAAWITARKSAPPVDMSADWQAVVQRIINAAEALDYAHSCGIVHRDIKPSNLLLDSEQKIWVTDFGLARNQNNLSLTRSGDLLGTMRYMSPEQACGRSELVDHRTDIYSLAVTLYEMLALRPAVQGEDGPSLLRAIESETPPRLRKAMPHLPADLDVVLRKAMAKETKDRYATAKEFADDLRAVIEGRSTVAKPPSLPTVVGRGLVRHRRLVTAASVVLSLAAVWLMISMLVIVQQSRQTRDHALQAKLHGRRARDTVDRLGTEVARRLEMIPGTERVRRSVLEETLDFYRSFVVDAASDPSLRAELALTHRRIGSLIQELESPAQAIVHFQRSAAIYEKLIRAEPNEPDFQRQYAQNLNLLGLALAGSGDFTAAEKTYRQTMDLQRQLVTKSPAQTAYQIDLGLTGNNLGLLLKDTDRGREAGEVLAHSIRRLTEALETEPESAPARRGLAAALSNLSALRMSSQPQRSVELLEAALDHQLKLARRLSNPLRASSEIATTYNNLGSAYLRTGQPREAVGAYTKAIDLQRQLRSLAPWVEGHRFELATSLNNLAKAYQQQNLFRQAERAVRQAIELQRVCLEADQVDGEAVSRLATMQNNLALALEKRGAVREALQAFQAAIDYQQQAIQLQPNDHRQAGLLRRHYADLLRFQIRGRRWNQTIATAKAYQRAALDTSQPDRLLDVAEDLAELSTAAPSGIYRDHTISLVATTILSAREAGVEVDGSLLQREPFRNLASSSLLQRAVKP
ncbi:MAG: serine/threonine-protein kinase, partial [Pirellulales bacterium]|nr:serine/threonine-protein kinase [Pirellulales bacterium]